MLLDGKFPSKFGSFFYGISPEVPPSKGFTHFAPTRSGVKGGKFPSKSLASFYSISSEVPPSLASAGSPVSAEVRKAESFLANLYISPTMSCINIQLMEDVCLNRLFFLTFIAK